jgi:glutaminyl-tRNA synthetase
MARTMSESDDSSGASDGASHFIGDIVDADLASGKHTSVVTRFPPEPNGYLHIGHAKSICLNFGLAKQYGGRCHLRFDDTNPTTEDVEYVESMQRDVRWLGFDWGEHLYFASDYFDQLYQHAVALISSGKAYVCSLSEDEVRATRGTITEAGTNSPYRDRSVEDNLDLFKRMKQGEFEDGAHVLRAKIDMAAPNMKLRDPPIYRIKKASHYRTGDAWCIYPLYDFTHCLSDSTEKITHSLCTLEFENNRALYDWVLNNAPVDCHPQQIEFARLKISYTMLSKRKLLQLVEQDKVSGWDDPRMPTIAGMRRRGYTAAALRKFCDMIGVAKNNSTVDIGKLEYCIRDDLNHKAPRLMCVTEPLKVVLTNYPEGQVEQIEAASFPNDVGKPGTRTVPLSREIYIERNDFMEKPSKKFFRLAKGREVRLRYAHVIRCDEVVKDEAGHVTELRCSYDANAGDRKVKGTIHWASAAHAIDVELRLYDRLFESESPKDLDELNDKSLTTIKHAKLEPSGASAKPGDVFQFERQGYFCVDGATSGGATSDSATSGGATDGNRVFNRTVTLRDTWAKLQARKGGAALRHAGRPQRQTAKKSAPTLRKEAVLTAAEQERADSYVALGVPKADAAQIAQSDGATALFDAAHGGGASTRTLANLLINELPPALGDKGWDQLPFGGGELAELVQLLDDDAINGTTAKKLLAEMVDSGGSPLAMVEDRGLRQLGDADLEPLITQVISDNADNAARYRAGKTGLMGFFVGQVMKKSQGKANAERAGELLRKLLS